MSPGPASRSVPLGLGSLRVIGDGRSAALLTPAGTVDWWCAPALDSRPVLWALLDPAAGAAARWDGVVPVDTHGPVASPCVRTVLRCGTARVECLDGLVLAPDGNPALVRLVRALDEPVELVHVLSAGGFDDDRAQWTPADGGVSGRLDEATLRVVATGTTEVSGDEARSRLPVACDRWSAVVVALGEPPALDPEALRARLLELRDDAERQVASALVPHRHADRVQDALRVLQSCTYSSTGAVVASLTTSLPEAPGEDRQFDYRYSWLRDASLAVSVASLLGRTDVARQFLSFARATVADDALTTPPVVTVRGDRVPDEREIDGVAGWAGSRPVRVGNGAGTQRQYDALGLFVEAVSVHLQTGGRLDGETWEVITRIADAVAAEVLSGEHPESSGIWELRTPQRLVSDDIGRWLVLDRAVWIARALRPWHRRGRWLRAREQVRARVLGVLSDDGSLPQSYDEDGCTPDASALAAAVFGLVGDDDPRASRLVSWLVDRLGAGELVHRYPPGRPGEPAPDGFHGREATFLPMAFWVVAALAAVGRVDEAEQRMSDLLAALPRLLPEEIDPQDGSGRGNAPLVWSHMALARAVYILQAARLRQRYGAVGFTAWRVVRYVRLRSAADRS